MEDFGQMVRRHRNAAGLSLRQLSTVAGIDWGYLGQIERGERRCSLDWVEIIDLALGVDGVLIDAYKEDDVRRRAVLGAATSLPLIAADAFGVTVLPKVGVEALRQDLTTTRGGDPADMAEWEEIAWQYACTYADTPPVALHEDLRVDLLVAGMQLRKAGHEATQRSLQRAIAVLAAFMAQTVGNLGDFRSGYRWWRTARQYADTSLDNETRVWVRGREVVRGVYEGRSLPALLRLADDAGAISRVPGIGTGEVLAGRAQTLATLGRADEALAAMGLLYDTFDQLPSRVADDAQSMFGWPEYRLRHTQSFVFTHLGDDRCADEAHDQALVLYPEQMARAHAQVELHRALRIVRSGDHDSGATYASRVIEQLPAEHRIEVVLGLGRSVVGAIPMSDRRRPPAAELGEMVALPSALAR